MQKLVLFGILSVPVIVISWRTLFHVRSHGFYRFISWEMILWLFVSNYPFWFKDPFRAVQIASWILLCVSAYLVIAGALQLKRHGKQEVKESSRSEQELYAFERTSQLADRGVYRYIRHPLYSSLLYLTWGIWLKNPELWLLPFSLLSTVCLWITARFDEKECIEYFGEEYRRYMKRSKMFVPFIL